MSIGGSGGTTVKSAALVAAPFGLAVVAVAPVCCLGSFCAVWPDGMVPDIICSGMYTYIFGVGAVFFYVLQSFAISQVCGFILFVSNNLFLFRRPPPMPLSDTVWRICNSIS